MHGHVHCDARPGNILVRKDEKGNPEIVLLDHGFYCSTSETFRKQFCELWYSMVAMDYEKLKEVSEQMGVGEFYRYLPLLFTYRTINTTKPLGGKLAPEERDFIKSNDEVNLDKIGMLLQKLPTDLVSIFRAIQIVGTHNSTAGGTMRQRLFKFTEYSIKGKT